MKGEKKKINGEIYPVETKNMFHKFQFSLILYNRKSNINVLI